VAPKGANSMAAPGFDGRKALVGTRWPISVLFGINGLRNKQFHLVEHLFPAFKARFSTIPGWYLPGALIEGSLSGGCG